MSDNIYFAAKESTEVADIMLGKAERWFSDLDSNGYLEKLKTMWSAYHGASYSNFGDGHQITFAGEQGELVTISINHLRNLAQHMLNMITSTRPAFQARAVNSDYKSLVQTKLAESLLDYYLREKRLEKYLKTAAEYAIVMGSGYIKMEWNETNGESYDYNEDTKTTIYNGDVEFSNLSPFDVVVDGTKEHQKHDWVLCRSFKNKFALAAKYPEHAEKIKNLPTKSDMLKYKFDTMMYETTDDIPVYEFYHRRDESMRDGRYLLFLSNDLALIDVPLPYRNIPIYRISPSDILGTPYGYTPLFDILPIQDAINSLYSTILTNQNAFGVQNIYLPRGADVSISQLAGGLNVIEGNAAAGKPEALNLTQTPPEVFKFLEMLERTAETISGVNSVARGNPEASLKSGAALALVQSMALQFMSGLQQSYIQILEDVGTGLMHMLQDFAAVPRIAAIAGRTNKTYMKEFSSDDIDQIDRVIVDVGNPLSKTTAGRVQMAENLLQYGLIKNPEHYISIINNGNLDVMTEDVLTEDILIRAENEKLVDGETIIALAIDNHAFHIKEHKNVLGDPDLRYNTELVTRTMEHILEHVRLARETDPDLLNIIGVQPLGPPGGSPANQPMPEGMSAEEAGQMPMDQPQAGVQGMEVAEGQIAGAGIEQGVNLPNIPTPPPPFEGAPMTPEAAMEQRR